MELIGTSELRARLNALPIEKRTIGGNTPHAKGNVTRQYIQYLINQGYIEYTKEGNKRLYDWDKIKKLFNISKTDSVKSEINSFGEIEDIEDIENIPSGLLQEYMQELATMQEGLPPIHQINLADKFWTATAKRFKLETQMNHYVAIDDVIDIFDKVLPMLKDSLYEIPSKIANKHVHINKEIIEDVYLFIGEALRDNLEKLEDYKNEIK